jgi:hypothetical protein
MILPDSIPPELAIPVAIGLALTLAALKVRDYFTG